MRPVVLAILLFVTTVAPVAAQDLYVWRYKAQFKAVPRQAPGAKTPDAPLAGNGDIGLTLSGEPGRLCFYLGKNDCWRPWPVYPGGGIALPGMLELRLPALAGGDWYAEQVMDKAYILGRFTKGDTVIDLRAWVAATGHTMVASLTANKPCSLSWQLTAPAGNASRVDTGRAGEVYWVTRAFPDTGLHKWPSQVAMALSVPGAAMNASHRMELSPGKPCTFTVTLRSLFDHPQYRQDAIGIAASLNRSSIDQLRTAHERWWRQYWSRSSIQIGDPFLEHYYYTSQYLLGCASRGDKMAPGIWGPFITKDSMAWGGDYHLNYNYQAPYWAAYSSNRVSLTDNFDQPLLDYMDSGRAHARQLLGMRGIYFPVGIGPHGLVTTRWPLTPEEMEKRYGTRENTIDNGYKFLGQKINAVFSVGNMLMRFYSTYDAVYARRIYPYMLACADFWEDYLKWEEGRYVIYDDHFNEVMPRPGSGHNWRERLGDFNSTLSLGLVKMLFKGMLDVSVYLGADAPRRDRWRHIYDHLSHFPVGTVQGRASLKSVERRSWGEEPPAGLNRVSIHGLILPGGVAGPVTDSAFNQILLNDVAHWKDKIERPADWGRTLGNGIETCFPAAVRVGYPAVEILTYLKARIRAQSLPNGWITQSGGGIETLAAVPLTVHEMLLQSYEQVLRIFPNWPRERDASFHQLRAYGAFLVSSRLENETISYVELTSEKGRVAILENPWPGEVVEVRRNGKIAGSLQGNRLVLPTQAGAAYRLTRKSQSAR